MSAKRDQFIKQKKDGGRPGLIIAIALAVVIVMCAGIYFGLNLNTKPNQIDPKEAEYIGRYLPKGYVPVKLTEKLTFDKRIDMVSINTSIIGGFLEIKPGDVIKNRIVYFEYDRPSDGKTIPLLAYLKPSGKLFTGVSLCAPCQATKQFIESDGLLTCGACGTKRDLETQQGISGACKLYPLDELPYKLTGNSIQIALSDLAKWKQQPLDRQVGE